MIRDWLNGQEIPHLNGRKWSDAHVRAILTSEKYRGDVLMQKTYVLDCISKKTVKNNGELPMYLVENNHPAIISREKSYAVQEEMARRRTLRSPSTKNKQTGAGHYSGKHALTERLICGECGTRYRRYTWVRSGKKYGVWRCVNRIDNGTRYCHNSPTMWEITLQEAILNALNSAMAEKTPMVEYIMDAAEDEFYTVSDSGMSLEDIKQRLEKLEEEFSGLLEKAADEGMESYTNCFREITEEVGKLKERRDRLADQIRKDGVATRQLERTRMVLSQDAVQPDIREWKEETIRQLVHTVKVISKDLIRVYLTNGTVVDQAVREKDW